MIELCSENEMAYLGDVDHAEQSVAIVDDEDDGVVVARKHIDEPAHGHVGRHARHLFLDDRVHAHECEHVVVGVVSNEFALTGQTHGIYAVGFEDADEDDGDHRDDDQRHKERIATGDLGNEVEALVNCENR